jgi:hypothetical protein
MTDEQRSALERLSRLTETGRSGGDPSEGYVYRVGGADNRIQLFQMGVTDADMRDFAFLTEWHWITLRECPVSDAGLKQLANQQGLRFLDIGETDVTSLQAIRGCVHLKQLLCDRLTRMTDRTAAALANLRELEDLDLCHTGVGDPTVGRLAACPGLRKLNLGWTRTTDESLRSLGAFSRLEKLHLGHTPVSDGGLPHLYPLRGLRLLEIGGTPVTKKGKAELIRAIPGLNVVEHGWTY